MLETIKNRRSIRKYKTDRPTDRQIETLLEAAMLAPSAKNGQPWHFVVCDDRTVIDALRADHPYAGMLAQAPVCIAVCGMEDPQLPGYWQQDCAAATQNLLLAAHELGLGTCWMGVAPNAERMASVKRILHLPGDILPLNLIAVGYPDELPRPVQRYNAGKVHRNRWGRS